MKLSCGEKEERRESEIELLVVRHKFYLLYTIPHTHTRIILTINIIFNVVTIQFL